MLELTKAISILTMDDPLFIFFKYGHTLWGLSELLTQFMVVVCSRWASEGWVRRGTDSGEALCSAWTRSLIRGGAGGG